MCLIFDYERLRDGDRPPSTSARAAPRSDRGARRSRARSLVPVRTTHVRWGDAARTRVTSTRNAESRRVGQPEVVEPESARVDDDMEQEDAFRVFGQSDQVVFTLGRALKMTGSAPNVVYNCCSKRCLHALEIQRPGWITRQRDKLRNLTQNRKATDRVRMALGVLNGSGVRGRFCRRGGVPHSASYLRAFMEIDAVLFEKNACRASRLQFVSAKFMYGKPLKEARIAAARDVHSASSNPVSLSPLELMTESCVCCQKDCLAGNLIAGIDATELRHENVSGGLCR